MDRDETRDWWLATIAGLMDDGWTPVSMAWDNASGNRVRIFPETEEMLELPIGADPESGGRGPEAVRRAQELIGRRVLADGHSGAIVDVVQTSNGYVRWLVEWEAATPAWWSREVSPQADGVELLPIAGKSGMVLDQEAVLKGTGRWGEDPDCALCATYQHDASYHDEPPIAVPEMEQALLEWLAGVTITAHGVSGNPDRPVCP